MRETKNIITYLMLFMTIITLYPLAKAFSQPLIGSFAPFRDESYIQITFDESMVGRVTANILRPLSYADVANFNQLGIPILPGMMYNATIELKRQGTKLKGNYTLAMAPVPAPNNDLDLAMKLYAQLQSSGSPYLIFNQLMSALYGQDVLSIPRPSVALTQTNVSISGPAVRKHYVLVKGLLLTAPVSCNTPFIDTLKVRYYLAIMPEIQPNWTGYIKYRVNMKTLEMGGPYPVSEESGRMSLNLDPILTLLPKGATSTIYLAFSDPSLRIVGGQPRPKLTIWNSGVWQYDPVLSQPTLVVEAVRWGGEPGGLDWLTAAAVVPPVAAGAYLAYTLRRRAS